MTKRAPAPKTRSQPRNEMQRESILDAASSFFIEKGFGGTNINDIADKLGMTRTAVYYYFPSKESILEALTEEVTQQASKLARTISDRAELPPDEALRQLIVRHATRNISGGQFEEDCEVWDATGRLVAQSRQLALLPRPTA